MRVRCPGCMVMLQVDDESYQQKVLLQCPECLYVFMAKAEDQEQESSDSGVEPAEDATLLTSDFSPEGDAREFQWNVPGASITVIEGDNQGIHLKLREERLVIGRKGADLVAEDRAVSRLHCELYQKEGRWWVRDLNSTNGTLVNGKKTDEALLHHLDEIRAGRTRILFAETEAPEERSLEDREDEDSVLDLTKVDSESKEPDLPLPRGRELILEYMTGPKKARSLKLEKGRVIIGRGEEADIELDDQGVSRKQTMIEAYSRDQIYISDLASQNGTWLNGIRIRTTRLLHGDLIRVGNTVLKFVVQDVP